MLITVGTPIATLSAAVLDPFEEAPPGEPPRHVQGEPGLQERHQREDLRREPAEGAVFEQPVVPGHAVKSRLESPQSQSPRWSHSTHLGRSVVPEVEKMQAVSAAALPPPGAGRGSSAAADAKTSPGPASPSGQAENRAES